jgi:hypothetical protein
VRRHDRSEFAYAADIMATEVAMMRFADRSETSWTPHVSAALRSRFGLNWSCCIWVD